ncbi:dihydrodipicolinate synthase family protein [Campylobacter fetus]|uniref:dihydrodipicolinate synthase family protein n=1 Tax=Campylobacter fetus TaxID=196 RepID=UPI0011CAF2FC|nr:dihydrodipicolinate synthase family protein [Campylobacter fetus]EAJ1231307.1 dihydrodipicolinate synthase family protein [Campylobacter fetus]EAK0413266.1 dihydrodipicolinate synthase family protein [Campylobacter fetus]TXF08279.1 dihydrodipicolinate synthase family protein [Campylobacter fetus subsp. fetus]
MKSVIYTPTVTIFDDEQNIDLKANARLLEYLCEFSLDGFVLFGSTGEFTAFDTEQKKKLIDLYLKISKYPLFVGTGSLNFKECVELSNYSIDNGAKGVLVVSPYYYAASQENLFDYYDKLAKMVHGNIFIYNYPARTGNDISSKTVLKLIERNTNIKGIKDTTPMVSHTKEIIEATKQHNFSVYSGFDDHFVDNIFAGGVGCISGLSNIAPDIWTKLVKSANNNDFINLKNCSSAINKLMQLYTLDANFSLIFKKLLNLNGLNLNENAIFPFNSLDEIKFEKAKMILEDARRLVK